MAWPTLPNPSNHPDSGVLAFIEGLQRLCVFFTIVFAAVTLAGWMIHPFGNLLPWHFRLMRANNAFLSLLCGVSVLLSQPRRSPRQVLAARFIGLFVILFALVILARDFGYTTFPIHTLLAADPYNISPGRVSPPAASIFLLLGFILVFLRARKHLIAHITDLATLGLVLAVLTFLARFVFGLTHLFTVNAANPFSAQTFFLLGILTVLVTTRRSEYGLLSVFLSSGIGGKTARVAAPCALLLPFVFATGKAFLVDHGVLSDTVATAVATSLLSIIALCLVLALAIRTDELERAVRELSLRDELTRVYNRRGFYVLAEQSLRLARRAVEPFFVLFIDVDELKKTNDALGHEVGSALLRAVAALIEQTFRETDTIGRLGGDEFVVAGRASAYNVGHAVQRLEEAAARLNADPDLPFKVGFSLGYVLSEGTHTETLEQLLEGADRVMYEAKRTKKRLRHDPTP